MKIMVLGLGYVGATVAVCLADRGHVVVGVDRSRAKATAMAAGNPPVREPGLEPLLRKGLAAGRLVTACDPTDHCGDADLAVVCVGTPPNADGTLSSASVLRVAGRLGAAARSRSPDRPPLLCVFRSTVMPGTMEHLVLPAMIGAAGEPPGQRYEVAFNPEFLRESVAVADFAHPPKIVIGERFPGASARLRGLYDDLDAPLFEVSFALAELIKLVDNGFHALKVAFANEVGRIAAATGVDARRLMQLVVADTKLNVSPAYLAPGAPFGGSCLPKDLAALGAIAHQHQVEVPVLANVLPSNAAHRAALLAKVRALAEPPARLLFCGLTFKPGTDDLRESPMVHLARDLIALGYRVALHDPDLEGVELTGQNLQFVLAQLPDLHARLIESAAIAPADYDLIVCAKPGAAPDPPIPALPLVDVTQL
ncbi:MAG TPA: nucleotide sugar dehydrogenase [Geminicoccaceae bacterium]|nr:nucleotide sugar dehydrogenase [Geminicoccaceae bacterium]